MKPLFESHVEFHVTTLGPVHAGSGFAADPASCAVLPTGDGGFELHHFDAARVVALASDAERDKLNARLTSGNASELFDTMRDFFSRSTERVRKASRAAVEAPAALADEYQQNAWRLKGEPTTRFMGRPATGGGPSRINQFEVALCARNAAGFYLPGSSIKGAIRTAWIAHLLRQRGKEQLSSFAPEAAAALADYNAAVSSDRPADDRDLRGKLGRASQRAVATAFTAQGGDRLASLSLDPLRFLKVRDSSALAISPASGGIRYVLDLKPSAEGILIKDLALRRVECVHEYQTDCAKLGLDIVDARQLDHAHRTAADRLPEPVARPTLAALTTACNDYYLHKLWQDIAWAQRLPGARAWATGVETWLRNGGQGAIEAGQLMLLRVGRHSGADAITLPRARAIKLLRGKDPQTGRKRPPFYDTHGPRLARAATLKPKQDEQVAPFGWLLLSPGPLADELRKPLADLYRTRFGAWLARVERAAAQAAQVERRRLEAEAEAQAERARQEERLKMSVNRQAIEGLRDAFAANLSPQGKPIQRNLGDALTRKVFDLLKAALAAGWTDEERIALADLLGTEAPRHIRLDSKERELKRGLRQLRGEQA